MADLFEHAREPERVRQAPLADRFRPRSFSEFFGQEKLVASGSVLRKAIENDELYSMLFWGPPGSGKTTLARLIAEKTKSLFVQLSAVASGIADLRSTVEKANADWKYEGRRTILFVDEIHRWNKAQQDALLPHVEDGTIVLIGATTENPSFEVIAPLLSRCQVYVLERHSPETLAHLVKQVLTDAQRGLGDRPTLLEPAGLDFLLGEANGDARALLNALEIAAKATAVDAKGVRHLSLHILEEAVQKRHLLFDKKGEEHYNVISAFIKSLRGSSADGAVYWLARMLEAGQDPLFIARRMLVFASEDVSLADTHALPLATAAFQAVERLGMPESAITLSHCAIYLALAPKNNSTYLALGEAKKDVQATLNEPVPLHLRNAPTRLMKDLGYGKEYKYSHDYDETDGKQEYLPKKLAGKRYFHPKKKDMTPKLTMFEDDPYYAQQLRAAYEAAGFAVTWFSSPPADPVAALLVDMPDVISPDLMMPVLDGFQVAEMLQSNRQTAGIPFVFVTSIDRAENRERALKLSAKAYLVKTQQTTEEIAEKVWDEVSQKHR